MSLGTFSSSTGLATFQVASGASLKVGDQAYADCVAGYATNIPASVSANGTMQNPIIGTVVAAGAQPGTVIITTGGTGTIGPLGWNPPTVNPGPWGPIGPNPHWVPPPGNTIPNPAHIPQPGLQYPMINGRLDTLLFAIEGKLQRMCSEIVARFTRKRILVSAAWHVIGPELEFDGAEYVGTDKRVSIAVTREEWPDAAIAGPALVKRWQVGNEQSDRSPPVAVMRATFELDRADT